MPIAVDSTSLRIAAAALFVLLLGQAVGLSTLAAPCALANCADDGHGTCVTPCAACLCCAPLRTLPRLDAALVAGTLTLSPLLIDRDTIPPDSPPHEILHVPKA